MRRDDILKALDVGQKWTRQMKAEERQFSARQYRDTMWANSRIPLKEICYELLPEAWAKASDNGRLPTHWRQVFYVTRPLCDSHPDSDRPLRDKRFKNILEDYLADHDPGWDVLRGARGFFKEPHRGSNDGGLAMSTMNVRNYMQDAEQEIDTDVPLLSLRFPTAGARNRIAAVLICEKEGFDELLGAEQVPQRFDLALMSTKGISAFAARDLARSLDAPCFLLHDMDKNGFVMASGFPFATDLGIRMEDVEQEEWGLEAEEQRHKNPETTYENLIQNGATEEEADFISEGQRVELNMFTSPDFIKFVEQKLKEHHVEKVVPDDETLAVAWERAHQIHRMNRVIKSTWADADEEDVVEDVSAEIPPMPDDLADQIRERFKEQPELPWDTVVAEIAEEVTQE